MKTNRLHNLDFIKGFAILNVMLGHFIQYYIYRGDVMFLKDPVFRWIYTFHMPLFMTISGYIFWSGQREKALSTVIINRLRGIGIPLVTWGLIFAAVKMRWMNETISAAGMISLIIKEIYGTWFLWSILICTCLLASIEKLPCRDCSKLVIHFIGFLLLLKVPNGGYYMFMYPFYLFGYLFHKHEKHIMKYKKPILMVSFVAFIVLGLGFGEQHYIYTSWIDPFVSPYGMKRQLMIDVYRYVTGAVGTISVTFICNYVFKKLQGNVVSNVLTEFGKFSLQLYLTQKLFLELIGPKIIRAFLESSCR